MTLTVHITRHRFLLAFNAALLQWEHGPTALPGTARIGGRTYVYFRKQGWRRTPRPAVLNRNEVTDYRW